MPDISNYSLNVEESPQYDLQTESDDYGLSTDEKIDPRYYVILDLNTGKPVRFWFGTLAEYNALPEIYGDVCYNIQERSCYVGEE